LPPHDFSGSNHSRHSQAPAPSETIKFSVAALIQACVDLYGSSIFREGHKLIDRLQHWRGVLLSAEEPLLMLHNEFPDQSLSRRIAHFNELHAYPLLGKGRVAK
jgi:hypothetical protein